MRPSFMTAAGYREHRRGVIAFHRDLRDQSRARRRASAFAAYLIALRALRAIYAERERMTEAECAARRQSSRDFGAPVWYPAEMKWRDATNRAAILWRLFLLLACDDQ